MYLHQADKGYYVTAMNKSVPPAHYPVSSWSWSVLLHSGLLLYIWFEQKQYVSLPIPDRAAATRLRHERKPHRTINSTSWVRGCPNQASQQR